MGMYQVKFEDGTHMKNDGEGNEGMHRGKLKEVHRGYVTEKIDGCTHGEFDMTVNSRKPNMIGTKVCNHMKYDGCLMIPG